MNKELFRKNFGNNLKESILKNFKTQKEFAEFFDFKTSAVSSWVKGDSQPDLFTLHNICKALGISIDYLIQSDDKNLQTREIINYNIFNEVVKFANQFAIENGITLKGEQYLAIYENIINMQKLNNTIELEDLFNILKPTLISLWKK